MFKQYLGLVCASLLAGCLAQPSAPSRIPLRAVYYAQGQGELSADDLRTHPEIAMVETFDELRPFAEQHVALWIDKDVTPLTADQQTWINTLPQAHLPIVLVGSSDTLYSFKYSLGVCCFLGPMGEFIDLPGFSVIQQKRTPDSDEPAATFLQGYPGPVSIQAILDVTNTLLDGKLPPTSQAHGQYVRSPQPIVPTIVGVSPVILYDEWPPDDFPNDAAQILNVALENNVLRIQVQYSGGCQDHTFKVYAATAFLQSIPLQALLYLAHDSHGDACEASIQKWLSFDLAPLDTERNDPSEHPLILRVYEPIVGSFTTEPFQPLIEWP